MTRNIFMNLLADLSENNFKKNRHCKINLFLALLNTYKDSRRNLFIF